MVARDGAEGDGAPDDAGIAAERFAPEALTEHQHRHGAAVEVAWCERAPERRLQPEDARHARRHEHRRRRHRRVGAVDAQGDRLDVVLAEALDAAGLGPVACIEGVHLRRLAELPHRRPETDQTIRLGERQRLQEDALHHAGDRGGGADAERHRQHDGERDRRRMRRPARRVAEIRAQLGEERRPQPVPPSRHAPGGEGDERTKRLAPVPGPRLPPPVARRTLVESLGQIVEDIAAVVVRRRLCDQPRGEPGRPSLPGVSGSHWHRRAPSCGRASWSNGAARVRRHPSGGNTCGPVRPAPGRATRA